MQGLSDEAASVFTDAMLGKRCVIVSYRTADGRERSMSGVARNLFPDLLLIDLGDEIAGLDLDWVEDVRVEGVGVDA